MEAGDNKERRLLTLQWDNSGGRSPASAAHCVNCFIPIFLPMAFFPPHLAMFLWTIAPMTRLLPKPCLHVCAGRPQPKTTTVLTKSVCFLKERDSNIFKVKTTVEMSCVLQNQNQIQIIGSRLDFKAP